MKMLTTLMAATLGLAALGSTETAFAQGEAVLIQNRVMMRVPGGVDNATELQAFLDAFHSDPLNAKMLLTEIDHISPRGIHLLDLSAPEGTNFDLLNERIETSYLSTVQWAEMLYDSDAPEASEGATGSTYVDGLGEQDAQDQFALSTMKVDLAHLRSVGVHTTVAILDTGIEADHPFLQDALVPGLNCIDDSTNTNDIGNGEDDDGDGMIDEMVGHGTFVAGLVHLVAPEAKLMPFVVLNSDGRGDLWMLTKGVYAAIDRGVEVINISVRSTYDSAGVENAIEEARALGIITVAASGNHGIERREFPSAKSDAFGVAAVDDLDVKAGFSSYSDKVFICAPGDSQFVNGEPILHRSIISSGPGGTFGAWEGTSMAAPLVAGAVALIRSQDPDQPADGILSDVIENTFGASAVNIYPQNPAFEDDELLGVGRVDAGDAVAFGPVAPQRGDIDSSGAVDVNDLLTLLAEFGMVHSPADLTGDGVVNVDDLLLMLAHWG